VLVKKLLLPHEVKKPSWVCGFKKRKKKERKRKEKERRKKKKKRLSLRKRAGHMRAGSTASASW
jgi:hypothetical protein